MSRAEFGKLANRIWITLPRITVVPSRFMQHLILHNNQKV